MQSSSLSTRLSSYRTVLFWPLTLDPDPGCLQDEIGTQIEMQIARLLETGLWHHEPDGLLHIPPEPKAGPEPVSGNAKELGDWNQPMQKERQYAAECYAEYTFFHDFVQGFLFDRQKAKLEVRAGRLDVSDDRMSRWTGRADIPAKPLYLFRRSDVTSMMVKLGNGYPSGEGFFNFAVKRLNLYVLRTGIAMMALDVCCTDQSLTLADALRLNDRLRRAHAPYLFPSANGCSVPNDMTPEQVTFGFEKADSKCSMQFLLNDDVRDLPLQLRNQPVGAREVPPFRHWAWLINGKGYEPPQDRPKRPPASGWLIAPAQSEGWTWRHVADDRLPILSAVGLQGLEGYRSISEGDWARLAGVDPPGCDRYPYAEAFTKAGLKDAAYDRYHLLPGESDERLPTRYLFSSYSMVAVGCSAAAGKDRSFFDQWIAPVHMRRHYFQLMLLAQMELAMLLSISSRVTLAVGDYEHELGAARDQTAAQDRLHDRLMAIEADLLQYVHRFRFTGVSNQLQPGEMFDKLRKAMRLDAIYADVKDELTTATAFLSMRAEGRQAKAQESLALVAGVGVVFGLAFSFLGMNVLMGADFLEGVKWISKSDGPFDHFAMVFAVIAVFCGGAYGLRALVGMAQPRTRDTAWRLRTFFGRAAITCGVGALVLLFLGTQKRPDFGVPQQVQVCTKGVGSNAGCPFDRNPKPAADGAPKP